MDDSLKYVTIRCSNHHETLASGLWKFLTAHERVDFDFRWGHQSVRAHRLILEVFLSVKKLDRFASGPSSNESAAEGVPAVADDQPTPAAASTNEDGSLFSLLEFLYSGKVTLLEDRLDDLLQLASELDFEMLVKAVESMRSDTRRVTRRQSRGNLNKQALYEEDSFEWDSDSDFVESPAKRTRLAKSRRKVAASVGEEEVSSALDKSGALDDVKNEVTILNDGEVKQELADNDVGKAEQSEEVFPVRAGRGRKKLAAKVAVKVKTRTLVGRKTATTKVKAVAAKVKAVAAKVKVEAERKAKMGAKAKAINVTRKMSSRVKMVDGEKVDRRKVWRMKQPTLKCNLCPYKTRDSTCFRVHQAKHDPSIQIFRCARCSKAFLNEESQARHKCRKDATPGVYVCPQCEYRTRNVTVYHIHLAKHDPSVVIHRCGLCGQAFLTLESLQKHEQNHPGPPKVYSCEQCEDFKSRSKVSLQVHQARKHNTDVQILKCGTCSRAFISEDALERHQLSHAAPPKLQQCPHCEFSTSINRAYYRHLINVHKVNAKGEKVEEKHRCPDCDFACRQPSQLRNHRADKHAMEKPFKCDRCPYASVRRVDMTLHVKFVHLGVRPFMCELCGHGSVSQNRLNRHMRCHTGEKPFACPTCDRRYADRHHYNEHLRKHINDDKPFVCHVCGYACNRRDNLKVHLRKVHNVPMGSDAVFMVQQPVLPSGEVTGDS